MLLFHLPPREVLWQGDPTRLSLSLNVEIEVTLEPPELFGEAEFTDTLRVFPSADGETQDLNIRGNLFAGLERLAITKPARFKKFYFDGRFNDAILKIQGNVATIRCTCPVVEDLYYLVQMITEQFASFFACATNAAVSISEMKGTANNVPFSVRRKLQHVLDAPFSINDNYHDIIRGRLGEVLQHCGNLPIQIVAAARYLSQAFLLESVSKYSHQFISERMLNVCKAVESITHDAGDSINKMKELLRTWGVHERYIDIFTSIRYLRNSLDIAHKAYSPLSADAFDRIQHFLPVAEQCTQLLIITAVRQFEKDPGTYKPYRSSGEDPVVIKKLADYTGIQFKDDGDLTTFN